MAIPVPIHKNKGTDKKHEIYNNKRQNLKRTVAQQNIISNLSTNQYRLNWNFII
jgi:hypothetical protein